MVKKYHTKICGNGLPLKVSIFKMSNKEDIEILKDSVKFEIFFKKYYREFCLIAYYYVRNTEISEEIVQDVLVKIWEKRDTLDIKDSLFSYIKISIKNSCFNFFKHKKITLDYEKEESEKISSGYVNVSEELQDNELAIIIAKALDKLPPQRRKIFLLSRQEGLKYHEIAEKLNLSIKTIEAQMGLALKQLREMLKDYI